jgi:acetate kinase
MTPAVAALVINAGSTSVKLAYLPAGSDVATWSQTLRGSDMEDDRVQAIADALRDAPFEPQLVGVAGHRIVHGGEQFDAPVVVDPTVETGIRAVSELAPLHNAAGLAGLTAARDVLPEGVVHIAVFDTAFHHSMPLHARAYGGPAHWLERGWRRYGFHGMSHEYAAQQAAGQLGWPLAQTRLVTCHLGGGCSITAVDGGRSIDTTMGFTPLDGVVMATRSGSVDPGLLVHLLRTGVTVDELDRILEHESGLLGLSGVSDDLQAVMQARDEGSPRARLAVDVFVHRVITGVGAMIGALGRPDALVFTGGIGEGSYEVRERVFERFSWTGARLLVVEAHEELAIAQAARAVVRRPPTPDRGTMRSPR